MSKTTSLVLWWWGARWLAHIWIYKALTEKGVIFDEVVGTSMWAIVWAGIALWYTWEEIIAFRETTNLWKITDIRLWLPSIVWGTVSGEKLLEHLHIYTRGANFDDTIVPLKVLATNAKTAEPVVFSTWDIAQALRASSSFPGVIWAYELDDVTYIDGGVCSNLPLWYATSDTIIACGFRGPIHWFLQRRNPLMQAEWLLEMLLYQQHLKDIALCTKELTMLQPDVSNISTFDFTRAEWIIEQGYSKAMELV